MVLEVIGSALVGFLFNFLGSSPTIDKLQLLSWQDAPIFALPTQPDPTIEKIVQQYLQDLNKKGLNKNFQGIWVQSEWAFLGNNQGNIPVSAASLTKIATSLAALNKLGTEHRFLTKIYTNGTVSEGILTGDLIIEGSADPLFVWEEAIALGNTMEKLGIKQVKGNLIIVGDFYMNFQDDTQISGALLKQALNEKTWSGLVKQQYATLPPNTPRPQINITGGILSTTTVPTTATLLLEHQSLTLGEIVKQMNIYSNNDIAEMLTKSVGGAEVVAQEVREFAKVPTEEIQLKNGSGLAIENRISPHAVVKMLIALQNKVGAEGLQLGDFFPMGGWDKKGTMQFRRIPNGTPIKTGTLREVSALAGVIPTETRGEVWFAIINRGTNIEELRRQQDLFLERLSQHLKLSNNPLNVKINSEPFLGDPERNLTANS